MCSINILSSVTFVWCGGDKFFHTHRNGGLFLWQLAAGGCTLFYIGPQGFCVCVCVEGGGERIESTNTAGM